VPRYAGDRRLDELGKTLCDNLESFFDDVAGDIKPSVLHGDLWSGNIAGVEGQPAIFDPATYYGEGSHEFTYGYLGPNMNVGSYRMLGLSGPSQHCALVFVPSPVRTSWRKAWQGCLILVHIQMPSLLLPFSLANVFGDPAGCAQTITLTGCAAPCHAAVCYIVPCRAAVLQATMKQSSACLGVLVSTHSIAVIRCMPQEAAASFAAAFSGVLEYRASCAPYHIAAAHCTASQLHIATCFAVQFCSHQQCMHFTS
jgi:hypothetical protein